MILIIDFGSQTTHLISRRAQEMGVDVEIIPAGNFSYKLLSNDKIKGIILSGGPDTVYAKGALTIDKNILGANIPILGICYGLQLITHLLGGKAVLGKKEYGLAKLILHGHKDIFKGLPKTLDVWMSHGVEVIDIPPGFKLLGSTKRVKYAAIGDSKRRIYGVQFHPEVHHTHLGQQILSNFVFNICGEKPSNKKINIDEIIAGIKTTVGTNKAVCALSGGIDSSVTAILAHKAIGGNLTCFYVDTGMMRLDETKQVEKMFAVHFKLNLKIIHAENIFLEKLKNTIDPEEKRKIIGETFIRVFEREALRQAQGKPQNKPKFLIQGTIYPDVIESKGTKHAAKIKTHHNVGGLPEKHGFKIVEPLRMLYKDEVREIAGKLGFPKELIHRHVFPGPGLAVRIIGEVTKEKLDILKRADAIVVKEIKKSGLHDGIWMAFAIFLGVKSTGVTGDERKYGETIAIRAIESKDTMTADWVRLPYDVLARISSRITTEVPEVVRVVYDVTTKPPATMEWE